jgi:hypothetical protein
LNTELAEDSYENLKSLSLLYGASFKFLHASGVNSAIPVSYTTNANLFRADFDESSWVDNTNWDIYIKNNSLSNLPLFSTNPVKLRSTIKNLMVTHGAIQKVYRSRFDEGRSNMPASLLSNTFLYYPLLTEKKNNYQVALGKNKETYFTPTFFNKVANSQYSFFNQASNVNNFILFDIPFLLSLKSDASRYLWFD